MTMKSMRSAPVSIPGKNPARMAPAGNLTHCAVGCGLVESMPESVAVGEELDVVVVSDTTAGADGEELADSFCPTIRQVCIPDTTSPHVYPNGQQLFPQVGRLSFSLVV